MKLGWFSELDARERRTFFAAFGELGLNSMDTTIFALVMPVLISLAILTDGRTCRSGGATVHAGGHDHRRGQSDRIFFNETSKITTKIRLGNVDSGWTLRSIDARSAVLEGNGRMVTLDLPEPSVPADPRAARIRKPQCSLRQWRRPIG